MKLLHVPVFLAALLFACDPVPLTIIDVPDGSVVMQPDTSPCSSSAQCSAGQFCEKRQCGAALGRCVFRPPTCPTDQRLVCGCDGVTYWNDCLRRAAQVDGVREFDQCTTPTTCDSLSACPNGASCARIVQPNECGRAAPGQCWSVPSTCTTPVPQHFYACGVAQTQCLDLCGAIRSEQPTAEYPGDCP